MSIDEQIAEHLETLVEPVDPEAVMATIDARRRPARRPRRWKLPAAVAAAVVLVAAAIVINATGERSVDVNAGPVTSTPAPSSSDTPTPADAGVTFGPLWTGPAAEPAGTLRTATSTSELATLWSHAGSGMAGTPTVDFDDQAVVSITIPDDACAPTLARFDQDGTTITPVFVESEQACTKPLAPKTYVVAIDWASVGDRFTLRLPANATYRYDEQNVTVVRPATHTTPGAAELTGRLELPTSAPTGTTITGTVIVDNRSGSPVGFTACDTPFGVSLHGRGIIQPVGFLACAAHMTFPTGDSRWPVTIVTKDQTCGAPPGTFGVNCTADRMPNLPAGTYRAVVVTDNELPPVDIADTTITLTD